MLSFLGFTDSYSGGSGESTPVLKLFRQRTDPFQSIFTIDAASYEKDAPKISEALQDYIPVILNLGHVTPAEGRRILDFCVGAVMVIGGTIRRVNKNVFVVAPPNVSVDDEDDSESLLA